MSNLTSKELTGLEDVLSKESLLIKKFQILAETTNDAQVKDQLNCIANKHQNHYNTLFSQL